jgi:hypothetical protein
MKIRIDELADERFIFRIPSEVIGDWLANKVDSIWKIKQSRHGLITHDPGAFVFEYLAHNFLDAAPQIDRLSVLHAPHRLGGGLDNGV